MDFTMENTMNSSDIEKQQALERKVRIKELMDDAAQIERQLPQQSSLETLEAVRKILSSSDAIMDGNSEERAKHSTEVVMDAQLLKRSHELVSKALQQESVFNEHIYQSSINRHVYRGDIPDWNVIADIVCGFPRTVRVQPSMLGVIEEELIERAVRQRQQRKRTSLAAEKRPEIVEKLTRQDKGAEKVNIIHKQLQQIFKDNDRKPIPFYKLIIDPNNFMNTVENAFQLSFLARDNTIAIETGKDNYPQVRLATLEERNSNMDTSQSMCTLNMNLCRDMILLYDIREPMLKPQMEAGTSS